MIAMILFLGLVFGAVFGFQAFKNKMMQDYFANYTQPPVTVSATHAEQQQWHPTLQAIGNVRAIEGVTVSAEVPGVVRKIHFEAGQQIKTGELLVQLDDSEEQATLRGLRASLELARANYQRERKLVEQHAISRGDFDSVQADMRNRQAEVESMEAVIAKKAVRAPFAGTLGLRQVDVGQYLAPGAPIVELQALDPVWVEFTLPEQDFHQVKTGQTVRVKADALPDQTFEGNISAVDIKVNEASRNFTIQATLPNPDRLLLPGMFTRVEVIMPIEDRVVSLPVTAVEYRLYGDSVFLLKETEETNDQGQKVYTVSRQYVETGEQRGDRVAILKGVEPGDYVVTSGQLKLNNDSKAVVDENVKL